MRRGKAEIRWNGTARGMAYPLPPLEGSPKKLHCVYGPFVFMSKPYTGPRPCVEVCRASRLVDESAERLTGCRELRPHSDGDGAISWGRRPC